MNQSDCLLYLVTNSDHLARDPFLRVIEEALQNGVTLLQLREKDKDGREFYEEALAVKELSKRYHVPLLIDDRIDVALAVDADGVHVGQDDLPAKEVRRILGPDKIVGVSAGCVEEAVRASADGADYLGVGAMYATSTKEDADVTSREELLKIRESVDLPIVVIGGINQQTYQNFKGIGIDGLAVVSAVIAAKDIEAAARELSEGFRS